MSIEAHVYHVTASTVARVPYFHDFFAARAVARALNDVELLEDATTLAWVVMPDHFHWLLQLGGRSTLSSLVRAIKSSSSLKVNRMLARSGALWQKGYYDHLVRDEENLRQVARYIVANPLRAGLVRRIADYPHWDAVWLENSRPAAAPTLDAP